MVDIEADGPIPGDYSMVCFGAIVVEPSLEKTFYGQLKPISEKWIPDALKVTFKSDADPFGSDSISTWRGRGYDTATSVKDTPQGMALTIVPNPSHDFIELSYIITKYNLLCNLF